MTELRSSGDLSTSSNEDPKKYKLKLSSAFTGLFDAIKLGLNEAPSSYVSWISLHFRIILLSYMLV